MIKVQDKDILNKLVNKKTKTETWEEQQPREGGEGTNGKLNVSKMKRRIEFYFKEF